MVSEFFSDPLILGRPMMVAFRLKDTKFSLALSLFICLVWEASSWTMPRTLHLSASPSTTISCSVLDRIPPYFMIHRRSSRTSCISMISSGFSFNDGEQILVSIQKPFGLVLEQDDQDGVIFVAEVDPLESGAKAGVQVGDILVSVQNASTASVQLEEVLEFIVTRCPRVVNLRFQRAVRN